MFFSLFLYTKNMLKGQLSQNLARYFWKSLRVQNILNIKNIQDNGDSKKVKYFLKIQDLAVSMYLNKILEILS